MVSTQSLTAAAIPRCSTPCKPKRSLEANPLEKYWQFKERLNDSKRDSKIRGMKSSDSSMIGGNIVMWNQAPQPATATIVMSMKPSYPKIDHTYVMVFPYNFDLKAFERFEDREYASSQRDDGHYADSPYFVQAPYYGYMPQLGYTPQQGYIPQQGYMPQYVPNIYCYPQYF